MEKKGLRKNLFYYLDDIISLEHLLGRKCLLIWQCSMEGEKI
jgi:hypothetical protein